MSLITYEEVNVSSGLAVYSAVFALPYLLRVTGGFLNKDPAKGLKKKAYLFLALLGVSTSLFSYFCNYFSFVLVLINLHLVLLTITSVSNVKVPDYLEFFNTVSLFAVFFTPVLMWAGLSFVWIIIEIKNLMCGKVFGSVLALGQIASGIIAFTAANQLDVEGFYLMSAVCLSLMIGQLDLLRD